MSLLVLTGTRLQKEEVAWHISHRAVHILMWAIGLGREFALQAGKNRQP